MSEPTATKSRRIYIAGPMTGIKNFNQYHFATAEAYWNSLQYHVTNPWDIGLACGVLGDSKDGKDEIGQQAMANVAQKCTMALCCCDAIYMIKGWEYSKGARAEHALAVWIGIDIYYEDV